MQITDEETLGIIRVFLDDEFPMTLLDFLFDDDEDWFEWVLANIPAEKWRERLLATWDAAGWEYWLEILRGSLLS